MDLPTINKRIDTLVARMLSVCEEENANFFETKEAASQLITARMECLKQKYSAEEWMKIFIQSDISSTIIHSRLEKGFSREEFAQKMGVRVDLVKQWESGEEDFSIRTLAKISVMLDIPIRSPY